VTPPISAAGTSGKVRENPAGGQLSRSALLFGLGALAGKGAALVTLPVVARLLTPEEFGRLDVLFALIGAALAILMLGTDVAATRLYFDRQVSSARRRLLSSWYAVTLGVAVPLAGVIVALRTPISQLLFGTSELADAVGLTGITILVGTVHAVTLGVLRTTGRPLTFAILEGSALVANAVLAVCLLIVWRADPATVLLALAISWLVSGLAGCWLVRDSIRARPAFAETIPLLRLGLPLVPGVALALGAEFVNRAYLLGSAGATEAAYLSIAIRIASVAGLVVTAAQLAWQPHAYELARTPDTKGQLGVEASQILVAVAACVGLLGLACPEVVALIGGPQFEESRPAVAVALFGVAAAAFFLVTSLPSAVGRATPQIALATSVGVVGAVAANLVLAQQWGAVGTAIAITSGQCVAVAAVVVLGRRFTQLPVRWARVAFVVLMSSIAIGVGLVAPLGWRLLFAAALLLGLWYEGTFKEIVARTDGRRLTLPGN
jgi:O-antigen/teichoic acid export membrane protein